MFFKPKHSHREDAMSGKEDKEDNLYSASSRSLPFKGTLTAKTLSSLRKAIRTCILLLRGLCVFAVEILCFFDRLRSAMETRLADIYCLFAYLAVDKHSHREDASGKEDKKDNLYSASSRSLRLCG
jgi:hypothetical protein